LHPFLTKSYSNVKKCAGWLAKIGENAKHEQAYRQVLQARRFLVQCGRTPLATTAGNSPPFAAICVGILTAHCTHSARISQPFILLIQLTIQSG